MVDEDRDETAYCFAQLPLVYVSQDSDSLPLTKLNSIISREELRTEIIRALENCTLFVLWNNRGMWGMIPKAVVTNVLRTYRDYQKLQGQFRDQSPKLVFNWRETIPVSATLGRMFASSIQTISQQSKQLRKTVSTTDSTASGKTN